MNIAKTKTKEETFTGLILVTEENNKSTTERTKARQLQQHDNL